MPEPSIPSGTEKGGYLRGGDEFTAMPGGPEGNPTLPEPSLPSGEERGGVLRPDDMVTRVGQAVTGQLVPLATQIAQQNQKKGPKRRQPTTGTLGPSGSLL